MSELLAEAAELLPTLQTLRRKLHSHPEVGLDLPHTQTEVLSALEGLNLEISTGTETTSVVAVLRGTHPDKSASPPSVLLRGDMDALPLAELTDAPFKSSNGNMHACGHDLHTAGLVGAARLLHEHRAELAGDVVFMFQPGEAINIIPASASLGATVRTLSQESLDIVRTQSKQLARGIAEAHGCTAEVDFQVQYPVTVNDETETEWTLDQVRRLLGADRVEVSPHPIMPSEDFSFVLREVPGTYMLLGAKRTDVPEERQGDNHSPFVVFDDTVLGDQAALLAHLAIERLRKEL